MTREDYWRTPIEQASFERHIKGFRLLSENILLNGGVGLNGRVMIEVKLLLKDKIRFVPNGRRSFLFRDVCILDASL